MTQIDWSKAPEGATHYANDPRCPDGIQWYLLSAGSPYKFWFSGRRSFWEEGAGSCVEPIANVYPIASTIWNGEGLPPVGTVCEQQTWVNRLWRQVTVIAHFNDFAVCAWEESPGDSQVELAPPGDLRPVRTPEQIADDKREMAINEMAEHMAGYKDVEEANEKMLSLSKYLHDAGYRKMMSDAEEVKS